MKISPRITSIALALALATVFSAQTPADAATPVIDFGSLDANKDGFVSLTEVQFVDDLRSDFATLDANSDDQLTPTEFSQWSRAGKTTDAMPLSPSTGPSGSSGSQHVPRRK